jgi:molecular chaperone DnaK (HSP70)
MFGGSIKKDVCACLFIYIHNLLFIWEGIDLSKDSMVIQRIREASEKAKIELSSTLQVINY